MATNTLYTMNTGAANTAEAYQLNNQNVKQIYILATF